MTPAAWLEKFGSALGRGDIDAAAALFEPGGFWRDLVAFTWNIKTCEGHGEIKAMLAACLGSTRPFNWRVQQSPISNEAWLAFETAAGRGIAHLRLREGRAWTLLTTLQELKGFEEKRDSGVHAPAADPYVVIVGGGQGGIALAARLKRLGVPAIVLEKNERAGDSWRKRYASLCLHDPVWYDHMPYLPFPDHWPVFTPKDRMGDWLEAYVKVMQLDYRAGCPCLRASYKDDAWEIETPRGILRAKHLVLATGMSGFPHMPELPGAKDFEGTLLHSSRFPGGETGKGKHCVVVGAGTSAHDICQDLHEKGAAAVTMIQRAPSIVVRSESLMELAWGPLYSEQAVARGITTRIADLTVASVPFKVLPSLQAPIYKAIREKDADLYAGLDKVGFQYDFGEDGSGIHALYLRRGAGYYIETGASRMIIEGKIRLRSRVSLRNFNEKSVTLTDGTELPAELVVFATGYGSMNEWARELISPEVADRVGKVWGLGSGIKGDPGPWVGELRNMWKPTAQPNLWFHGGNLMQSRHYSLYLALQLKARMEGIRVLVLTP